MKMLIAAALLAATAGSPAPSSSGPAVHIRNESFIPATLTVNAGQSVTFVNDDDDAHTATADDKAWDSDGLNQGEHWSHVFTSAGKVTYHCTVHPMMHGTIVVRSAS
jgi:plastocyanin